MNWSVMSLSRSLHSSSQKFLTVPCVNLKSAGVSLFNTRLSCLKFIATTASSRPCHLLELSFKHTSSSSYFHDSYVFVCTPWATLIVCCRQGVCVCVQVCGHVSVCGVVVKERKPGCIPVCMWTNWVMDTKFNALTVNCVFKSDSGSVPFYKYIVLKWVHLSM